MPDAFRGRVRGAGGGGLAGGGAARSSRLHTPLPTDPYQPKRRLAPSSSASAAITSSLETPGETESIGSFSVGV